MIQMLRSTAILAAILIPSGQIAAQEATSPAQVVKSVLAEPDSKLDYLTSAEAFDDIFVPASTNAATEATIARLVDAARQMAGPRPTDEYKLAAIRKAIYESGPWNYNRAFAYDHADPLGKDTRNKLLSTYVRKRLGNCVSMPTLFLIIADRLDLDVHLATAPLHVFVRYANHAGVESNLETTSGGHAARTEFYRQNLPMSDQAIKSGIYMRTLSKRESVAEMANTVLDFMIDQHRYQEAIDVADEILKVNPREAYTMVRKGTAYGEMMRTEFTEKYPTSTQIPPALRPRYRMLENENAKAFNDAEALGWKPDEQE